MASLSFNAAPSGGQKALTTVTVSASAHTATTSYIASVATPQGHTQTIPFKTDGSGAATFTFVPATAGTYTVTTALAVPATVATANLNVGGHG